MSQEFYINHTTKNIEITWKGRKNQIWKVILSLIIPLIFIFVIMLQAKRCELKYARMQILC